MAASIKNTAPAALHLASVGAATAIGGYVAAIMAAQKCQMPNFTEHPYLLNLQGAPYVLACAPYVDTDIQGVQRFQQLANYAISDCCAGKSWLPPQPIPSVLCLPEPRPTFHFEQTRIIAQQLAGDCSGLSLTSQDIYNQGHAAGYNALEQVHHYLTQTDHEFCLLVGVDSMIDSETLNRFEMNGQIHSAENAYGFIPGEGAACIIFCLQNTLKKHSLNSLGSVTAFSYANEPIHHKQSVCTGKGLTQAIQCTLKHLVPKDRIHHTFCDLNGETHRSDEYGFTLTRLSEHFENPNQFTAPADCWGDIGAASSVLNMVLASARTMHKGSPAAPLLLWGSSHQQLRGAALFYPAPRNSEEA